MNHEDQSANGARQTRRNFLKQSVTATVVVASAPLLVPPDAWGQERRVAVALVLDPSEELLRQSPVRWALDEFCTTLRSQGLAVQEFSDLRSAPAGAECLVVTGRASASARQVLVAAQKVVADVPEALGLVRGSLAGREVLLVCGADGLGLVYALLELVDQLTGEPNPRLILAAVKTTTEQPANRIRSVARFFVSDVEDKSWFHDREFWRRYLTMLASHRFNRFSLTLGIGYDFTNQIRDCYFHFAYPFLLLTPGYEVRAVGLPDAERNANLAMLKFIGAEAIRRGLHFQLGLWTHAYRWTDSPDANYTIAGLTPATHAAYCRDSLRTLLQECPAISGVTLRVHGESGVAEGSDEFWKSLFQGVAQCGRAVELDLHAKGIDQSTIAAALATGMPVNISPKFWAEHCGLPYMQAAIRPLEMPAPDTRDNGFFARSNGSRKFLRYGYGDLLAEERKHGVLHRVWPGTQRLLLWGDPVTAAAYGRNFSFCGSAGVEWCEPLSFKGRKGGGLPGSRDGYLDPAWQSPGGGWEKYAYTYRLWGRLAYRPDADPAIWQRHWRRHLGTFARAAADALAIASRILPLITTAHCPSAANNNYWPEIYTNMSIPDPRKPHPYGDTNTPKRFGAVSPLDPELFSRMDDFASALLAEKPSAKYSPAEVAVWLLALADTALAEWKTALARQAGPPGVEFQRLGVDVTIQAAVGRFFAHKFRAGVLFALHEKSRSPEPLSAAIREYHQARSAWDTAASVAAGHYVTDLTFGRELQLRGTWSDRLPAIDEDIADLERRLVALPAAGLDSNGARPAAAVITRAMSAVLTPPARSGLKLAHVPPSHFQRGAKVVIEVDGGATSWRLHYRRVNQAESWNTLEMESGPNRQQATIPAEYTDSPFPLQYYFEVWGGDGRMDLFPGFDRDRANQPYFVVRQKLVV